MKGDVIAIELRINCSDRKKERETHAHDNKTATVNEIPSFLYSISVLQLLTIKFLSLLHIFCEESMKENRICAFKMIQNVIENDAEIDYNCEKATWEFKHQLDYWIKRSKFI